MKRVYACILCALFCMLPASAFAESDMIICSEDAGSILCSLQISEFITRVQPVLTNGWENTLKIQIWLLSTDGTQKIARSQLEATQRCYLDPFESPCLILWSGAARWQRYRDEEVFLRALSQFGIQALKLDGIEAGNYFVRMTIQVMPSALKRIESIRAGYKASDGDSSSGSWSTSSFISAVMSSQASVMDDEIYETTLETLPFFIDPMFTSRKSAVDNENDAIDDSTENSDVDDVDSLSEDVSENVEK